MVKHIVDKLCLFKNLGRHAWSGIWNLFSGKNLDVFETCYPALDKPNFDLWKPIKDFGCVLIVDFVPNFHNGVSGSKKTYWLILISWSFKNTAFAKQLTMTLLLPSLIRHNDQSRRAQSGGNNTHRDGVVSYARVTTNIRFPNQKLASLDFQKVPHNWVQEERWGKREGMHLKKK